MSSHLPRARKHTLIPGGSHSPQTTRGQEGTARGDGRRRARTPRDRGSMAVEFVVAAPAFIVLLLLVGAGGQWVSASGEVGAAARDAVRQASLEVRYADAQSAAQATARADLKDLCQGGADATVELLEGGRPAGRAAWANGAQVIEVKVSCTVNLKAFTVTGIPASHAFTDIAAAPLDPFSQRTG